MSTRSSRERTQGNLVTNPKYYPHTQGITRLLNRIIRKAGGGSHRRDSIAVRVLDGIQGGAPARFVASSMEIDIQQSLLDRVDPLTVGTGDFVAKHPATAGACIHEAAHANFSTISLDKTAKTYGGRHTEVMLLLEEGRIETQIWPHLLPLEQEALRSMVLDIVLQDLHSEDGEELKGKRLAVRLLALIAARMKAGIINADDSPKVGAIRDEIARVLGDDWYARFAKVALDFAQIQINYWSDDEKEIHERVREWMALEDECLKDEPKEPGKEGKPGKKGKGPEGEGPEGKPGKEGESKEGDGKGGKGGKPGKEGDGAGKDKKDGKSDESGTGEEKSESESKDGEKKDGESGKGKSSDDDLPGDDDEGKVGDGSQHLKDEDGGAALGGYASGHLDGDLFDNLEELVKEINVAAEEVEKISGSRIKDQLIAVHRADAKTTAERRRRKVEAKRLWDKKGR